LERKRPEFLFHNSVRLSALSTMNAFRITLIYIFYTLKSARRLHTYSKIKKIGKAVPLQARGAQRVPGS